MKRTIVLCVTLILLLIGTFSIADEKERQENGGVLHTSMNRLSDHMNMIFQSILRSDYSSLAESADVFNKVAENLAGTKPPKNSGDMKQYNSNIEALRVRGYEFEGAAKGKNPEIIVKSFGTILEICVKCHTRFRD